MMHIKTTIAVLLLASVSETLGFAQPSDVVPALTNFSGAVADANGKPLTAVTGVTFSLYKDAQGGAPLWTEIQNVKPDPRGRYTVTLGATTNAGLPASIFAAGEARWLGVQVEGQAEQPRIMLLSVPYALKAGDAATIGGLPPSAFILASTTPAGIAPQSVGPASTVDTPAVTPSVTGSGAASYVPLWSTATALGKSLMFQSGTGTSAKLGVNTTTPASTLDINGGGTIRGALTLPATGIATATAGFQSQPQDLAASAFSSASNSAVGQTFQWQAEPVGNGTATPSASLNLLFGQGAAAPAETGLSVAGNGLITFAPGQTFPGTGVGTITGVTAGAGLVGGGAAGSVSLSIPGAAVTNAMLQNSSVTVTPGTGLTGGGAVSLGGATTLNLDTTKVPLLTAPNTFTANQAFSGNIVANGSVTAATVNANAVNLGGYLFAWGSYSNENAFLGFGGGGPNSGAYNTAIGDFSLASLNGATDNTAVGVGSLRATTSGSYNTGMGAATLSQNTSGTNNTAVGVEALPLNTIGTDNTAVGFQALGKNTTGSYNAALGEFAGQSSSTGSSNTFLGVYADAASSGLNNATAVGANARVGASNALVLGAPGTQVGIGTSVPTAPLTIQADNRSLTPYQIQIQGSTNSNEQLLLGYNTTGQYGYGSVQAIYQGVSSTALALNPFGGPVLIGTSNGTGNPFVVAQSQGTGIADGWTTYSSRRWKTNIRTLSGALNSVNQLRGVSYDLKAGGKHEIGVIAEEVGAVVPEIVQWEANGKNAAGVDYARISALLIEAVKDLSRQNAELRTRVGRLERRDAGGAATVSKRIRKAEAAPAAGGQ
ncbi:MAG: tail fiber domain-containing protein [Bryobacteraceae bacterium]